MNRVTGKPFPGGKYGKGICGNPAGRPKGTLNERTKRYARIKAMACEDYEKAYNLLWEAVEAKEGWAHQLFFKDLLPKKFNQPTVFIEYEDDKLDGQITSLRKGLAQFTEHTEDSLIAALKVLGSIKINDNMDTQIAPRETRESLIEKIELIGKILESDKNNQLKETSDE